MSFNFEFVSAVQIYSWIVLVFCALFFIAVFFWSERKVNDSKGWLIALSVSFIYSFKIYFAGGGVIFIISQIL